MEVPGNLVRRASLRSIDELWLDGIGTPHPVRETAEHVWRVSPDTVRACGTNVFHDNGPQGGATKLENGEQFPIVGPVGSFSFEATGAPLLGTKQSHIWEMHLPTHQQQTHSLNHVVMRVHWGTIPWSCRDSQGESRRIEMICDNLEFVTGLLGQFNTRSSEYFLWENGL